MTMFLNFLFLSIGLFFILSDVFNIPYLKTSVAVITLSKGQRVKEKKADILLYGVAKFIAKHLRLNEFKRADLEAELKSADLKITPEMYKANAIVKAGIVGILAIPAFFLFPVFSPLILIAAVVLYLSEGKSAAKMIKLKKEEIEYELPRLVFTIQKTLSHNRDIIYILNTYAENAGEELKKELKITTADMQSGNYESAIARLESRVGSAQMSEVCRGLLSVMRGDETSVYWANLLIKLNDIQRQNLKKRAGKIPGKVKRLSVTLLVCFMLVFTVVILYQIVDSLGVLF